MNVVATRLKGKKGVYVFIEGDKAVYVGKTDNLGSRLKQHTADNSTHYSANFAFKIARPEWSAHEQENPSKKK
jgi:predicted GIY-YIG superfamily endonuclease